MKYRVEVMIAHGEWTPLRKSEAMNLSREEACDLVMKTRMRPEAASTPMRFRIVQTLGVE